MIEKKNAPGGMDEKKEAPGGNGAPIMPLEINGGKDIEKIEAGKDSEFTGRLKAIPGKRTNGSLIEKVEKEALVTRQKDLSKEKGKEEELDWRKYLVTKEPENIPPLIKIGDVTIASSGDHSLVIGKKKSRKTLFLVWLISQYKSDISKDVLLCDTEQGFKRAWKTRDRIKRLTGYEINLLSLRGLSIAQRKQVIEAAIKEGKYKVVVIDGIRDLLSNINDVDQVATLLTWVERLTVENDLHIVNVLHQNKNDDNARGHLGSELTNKAEVTISLEKNASANCTVVTCESARDIEFEPFAFTHNVAELPELVPMPIKGKVISEEERKERLKYIFETGPLKYQQVINGIKIHFKLGTTNAGYLLGDLIRDNLILKMGPDRHPDTVYKLR